MADVENPPIVEESAREIADIAHELENEALNKIPRQTIVDGLSLFEKTGDGLGHAFTKLDVSAKDVENIQPLLAYIHLRHVNLSKNSIIDLKPLDKMHHLLFLDASVNKLKSIPAQLEGKPYLQYIDASQNEISTFGVSALPTLAHLNLSNLTMDSFPSLKVLEVRANEIERITALNTETLEKLYIAQNKLTALVCLEDKPMLTHIHARDNQISTFDIPEASLQALTYLNLRNNLIESFTSLESLAGVPTLASLNLSGNPIDQLPNYRMEVLMRLRQIVRLDKEDVLESERTAVDAFREKCELEVEEARVEGLRVEAERVAEEERVTYELANPDAMDEEAVEVEQAVEAGQPQQADE